MDEKKHLLVKLREPHNPLFGGAASIDAPIPTCCGAPMQLVSSYVGLDGWWAFDCGHCGAMVDVCVNLKERQGCFRCGGKRCTSDDNHLGDDGGYLI